MYFGCSAAQQTTLFEFETSSDSQTIVVQGTPQVSKANVQLEFSDINFELKLIFYIYLNYDNQLPVKNMHYYTECKSEFDNLYAMKMEKILQVDHLQMLQIYYTIPLKGGLTKPEYKSCEVRDQYGTQIKSSPVVAYTINIEYVFALQVDIKLVGGETSPENKLNNMIGGVLHIWNYRAYDTVEENVKRQHSYVELLDKSSNDLYDKYLQISELLMEQSPILANINLKSIKYCQPRRLPLSSYSKFNFRDTLLHQSCSSDVNCANENLLPYEIKCVGDRLLGAYWAAFDANQICYVKSNFKPLTIKISDTELSLYNGLLTPSESFDELHSLLVDENEVELVAFDIIQIGKMFQQLIVKMKDWLSDSFATLKFMNMFEEIAKTESTVMRTAAQQNFNSTNIMLDLLNCVANYQPVDYDENGLNVMRTSKLIVYQIDPTVMNIGGVALYLNSSRMVKRKDLNNYFVKSLSINQTVEELLDGPESRFLQTAAFVPSNIYDFLKGTSQAKLLININIFLDDKLFQTNQESHAPIVISLSIPNFDNYFPYLLPSIFKTGGSQLPAQPCKYYNFHLMNSVSSLGEWTDLGCDVMGTSQMNDLVACGCNHLTNFAALAPGDRPDEYVECQPKIFFPSSSFHIPNEMETTEVPPEMTTSGFDFITFPTNTEYQLTASHLISEKSLWYSDIVCLDEDFRMISYTCYDDIYLYDDFCKFLISNEDIKYCPDYFDQHVHDDKIYCIRRDVLPDKRLQESDETCSKGSYDSTESYSNHTYLSLLHLNQTELQNRENIWFESFVIGESSYHFLHIKYLDLDTDNVFQYEALTEICEYEFQPIIESTTCAVGNQYASLFDFFESKCYELVLLPGWASDPDSYASAQLFQPLTVPNLNIFLEFVRNDLIGREHLCLVDLKDLHIPQVSNGIATINHKGEIFVNGDYNCVIEVHRNSAHSEASVDLNLEFKKTNHEVHLIVSNKDYLYRPYKDPNFGIQCRMIGYDDVLELELLSEMMENSTGIEKTRFDIKLNSLYPQKYYCESVTINGRRIRSPEVIGFGDIQRRMFAVILLVHLDINNNVKDVLDAALTDTYHYRICSIDDSAEGKVDERNVHLFIESTATDDITGSDVYDDQKTYEVMMTTREFLRGLDRAGISFISIKSIKYCFAQLLQHSPQFVWRSVQIGRRSSTDDNCLNERTIPHTRKCLGDIVFGGEWEDFSEEEKICKDKKTLSRRTLDLFEDERYLLINPQAATEILYKLADPGMNYPKFIPVDVLQLGQIIERLELLGTFENSLNTNNSLDLVTIIDKVARMSMKILSEVAQVDLGTTNIVLESLDALAPPSSYDANGISIIETSDVKVFYIDPSIKNITGIALFRESQTESNSETFRVEYLFSNQMLDGLLSAPQNMTSSLEVATFLPEELYRYLIRMNGSNKPLRVVVTVFLTDKLFQTNQLNNANSVISVSIPGHTGSLPHLLPTIYKLHSHQTSEYCGYFDLQPEDSPVSLGEWSQWGCTFIGTSDDNSSVACGCNHMTHFSFLLTGHGMKHNEDEDYFDGSLAHNLILDWITRVCNGLSMMGILFIVVTSIMFRRWRSDIKNLIILQFSFAIGIQIILLMIADSTVNREKSLVACVMLGSSIQYIILVTFSWMLVLALRQYHRFVTVFNSEITSNFFCLSMLIGWVFPLIPTIISASVAPQLYTPISNEICYPKDHALYFGLVMPILIIVSINLTIFVLVIRSIFLNANVLRTTSKIEIGHLRIIIILFFVLGLTWIFGLLSIYESKVQICFAYIFNITAPSQGFIIFVYSIVLNPRTRRLWLISYKENISKLTESFFVNRSKTSFNKF